MLFWGTKVFQIISHTIFILTKKVYKINYYEQEIYIIISLSDLVGRCIRIV